MTLKTDAVHTSQVLDSQITFNKLDAGVQAMLVPKIYEAGLPATARITLIDDPAPGELISIGADVYEFTLGPPVAPGNIAVICGGGAGGTLTDLAQAINGFGTAPTESIGVAMLSAPSITIVNQDAPPPLGITVAGTQNLVLSDTMGSVNNGWDRPNLNYTGHVAYTKMVSLQVTLDAFMADPFTIETAIFSPAHLTWSVSDATGHNVEGSTGSVTTAAGAFGSQIIINRDALGVTPLVNGDIVTVTIYE